MLKLVIFSVFAILSLLFWGWLFMGPSDMAPPPGRI